MSLKDALKTLRNAVDATIEEIGGDAEAVASKTPEYDGITLGKKLYLADAIDVLESFESEKTKKWKVNFEKKEDGSIVLNIRDHKSHKFAKYIGAE